MKKILVITSLIFLASCAKSPVKIPVPVATIPDCQSRETSFREEAQTTAEEMGENVWIVDMELFYSPKLQNCVGKYMASRKEGKKEDVSVFVIKNIGKNEDIYFQKYTGPDLKNEYE